MTTVAKPDYDRELFNLRRVITSPVIIDRLELVRWNNVHFVRARSTDGSEGMAMISEQPHVLAAILQQLVIPFFPAKMRATSRPTSTSSTSTSGTTSTPALPSGSRSGGQKRRSSTSWAGLAASRSAICSAA